MTFLRKIARYWYIPVVVLGLLLLWLLTGGRRQNPFAFLTKELEAINAKAEVQEMKAQLGTEQALQHVKDRYRSAFEKLDEEQKARAKILENDPAALAKFIVRGRV